MEAIVGQATEPAAPTLRSARIRSEQVQGLFMVALLLFGAWQGGAALMTKPAQRRLSQVVNVHSLLDGRTAATVNYVEAHYLPADAVLRALGGVFRWRLFGSGGPQVAVGCDDWLFLTEELRTWPDAGSNLRVRTTLLKNIAAKLAGRGIDLVVAVVPDKARIEAATLCGAPRSAQADERYGAVMDILRSSQITTVDLAASLSSARRQGPLFLRTDTHWNQEGAAIAARLVAAAVRTPLNQGFAFRTERAAIATDGPGDMLRLMSLDLVPDIVPKLRPRPDLLFVEHTVQTGAPAESGGLLDAGPGDQIVLLGSSYSLNSNFHGRLQEFLEAPVSNLAEAGGGFASSANSYFKGTSFTDTPPRLIIWEVPERVLVKPLEAADHSLMELLRGDDQGERRS